MTSKAVSAIIFALALAGAALHGQDKSPGLSHWKADPDGWMEYQLEVYQVPMQDREDLKRLCSTVPLPTNSEFPLGAVARCLSGCHGFQKPKFGWEEWWIEGWSNLIYAPPYGHLAIGCHLEKGVTPEVWVSFVFKNWAFNVCLIGQLLAGSVTWKSLCPFGGSGQGFVGI